MELNNLRKKKIIYLFILFLVSQIMIFLVTPVLITYFFDTNGLLSEVFAECLSFIIPVLILLLVSSKKAEKNNSILLFKVGELYKKPIKKANILMSSIIGILLSIIVLYSINFFEILYIINTLDYEIISTLPEINIIIFLFSSLIYALLPAIFEELLYRGMYFDTFKSANKGLIIVVPTLIFVFAHNGIISAFSSLILSIVLMYLILKGVSIILCTVIHFTYNFTALFFANVLSLPLSPLRLLNSYSTKFQMIGALFIYGGIIVLLGYIVIRLSINLKKKSEPISSAEYFKENLSILEKTLIIILIILAVLSFAFRLF